MCHLLIQSTLSLAPAAQAAIVTTVGAPQLPQILTLNAACQACSQGITQIHSHHRVDSCPKIYTQSPASLYVTQKTI
jgi:hypothetical protein